MKAKPNGIFLALFLLLSSASFGLNPSSLEALCIKSIRQQLLRDVIKDLLPHLHHIKRIKDEEGFVTLIRGFERSFFFKLGIRALTLTGISDELREKVAHGGLKIARIRKLTSGPSYLITSDGLMMALGSTKIPILSGYIDISVGEEHTLLLTPSGRAYALGKNTRGQLGLGTGDSSGPNPMAIELEKTEITDLDEKMKERLIERQGLKSQFTNISIRISINPKIKQVIAIDRHSFLLTESGQVFAFGDNSRGQLGLGNKCSQVILSPVLLQGIPEIIQIAASAHHAVLLSSSGEVWVFGTNDLGETGLGHRNTQNQPTRLYVDDAIEQIAVCGSNTFLLGLEGIWVFGKNARGQLGLGHAELQLTPIRLAFYLPIKKISPAERHTLLLTKNGEVWGMGSNEDHRLGIGGGYEPRQIPIADKIVDIGADGNNSLFIDEQGRPWTCGGKIFGYGPYPEPQPLELPWYQFPRMHGLLPLDL